MPPVSNNKTRTVNEQNLSAVIKEGRSRDPDSIRTDLRSQAETISCVPTKKPRIITEEQIIAAACVFQGLKDYGNRLPTAQEGKDIPVPGLHKDENWLAINSAIRGGHRGLKKLKGGLRELLMPLRLELVAKGKLKADSEVKGDLKEDEIIASARLFQEIDEYGNRLPTAHDVKGVLVPGMHRDESWRAIDCALKGGKRGLAKLKHGLSELLEPFKLELTVVGKLRAGSKIKGDLSDEEVIESARLFQELDEYGNRLPHGGYRQDVPVPGLHRDETWMAINVGIKAGRRGLIKRAGGLSELLEPLKLELMAAGKLKADSRTKGDLSEEEIIASARLFQELGEYGNTLPGAHLGEGIPVPGMHPDITWSSINDAIRGGCRGFEKKSGLKEVLEPLKRELVVAGKLKADTKIRGELKREEIIASARLFQEIEEFGSRLPNSNDASDIPVPGMHVDESWMAINYAIRTKKRGLKVPEEGLSELLEPLRLELIAASKLKADSSVKGHLSEEQIIESVCLFFEEFGRLPNAADQEDKPVPGMHRDETWRAINQALYNGYRGLNGDSSLSKLLKPLKDKLSLSLSKSRRPNVFKKDKAKPSRVGKKERSLATGIERRSKPLINFAKGEAFEQVAGLLLASLYPEELVIPQYCLRIEPENKYFGMRADYKVGNEIYEVKWGKASGNIIDTYNKHNKYLPEGMNYRLLMLEANGEVGVPYDHFDMVAARSPLKKPLQQLVVYIRELVDQDAGFALEDLRNYLYGLVMKANKSQGADRLGFIAEELSGLLAIEADERCNYMKPHSYALYSPLEAYCEYEGKLWRDLIEVRTLDLERPGQYELRHYLNNLSFEKQVDRDIAVVLEMTEDGFRTEDLLEESESGKYDEALFRLPNGETLASRASALTADHIIDSIDDLKILFDFAAGDFEFAKEFIISYS